MLGGSVILAHIRRQLSLGVIECSGTGQMHRENWQDLLMYWTWLRREDDKTDLGMTPRWRELSFYEMGNHGGGAGWQRMKGESKIAPFTCLRCLLDIQVETLSGPFDSISRTSSGYQWRLKPRCQGRSSKGWKYTEGVQRGGLSDAPTFRSLGEWTHLAS